MTELGGRLPAMSLAVVGVAYANKDGSDRGFEILLCKAGEPVALEPEPKNKKDENAVKVLSACGVQIGYLTAERAPWLSRVLRSGRETTAVFQRKADWGAWIRVAFDGEVPVVAPEMEEGRDAEPEFYPDEVWPDD